MQPKISLIVRCTDREVGEISRIIVDPLDREISHIVVKTRGEELLIPTDGNIAAVRKKEFS
jgi:hypothetical protein